MHVFKRPGKGALDVCVGGSAQMPEVGREDVDQDTLLRLDVAARLAFPDGSIGMSSLRREAKRGRLLIWRVANKDMTTLAEIKNMIARCRVPAPEPDASPVAANAVAAPPEFLERLAKRRREGKL